MYKSLIALALVACVGLSATAAPSQPPASTTTTNNNNSELSFGNLVCEACESLVAQVQTNLPQMRPQLDQMCQYCGSPEANQKCLDKLHEIEDKVEHESPRNVCVAVGLCQPKQDSRIFYDFSGQF